MSQFLFIEHPCIFARTQSSTLVIGTLKTVGRFSCSDHECHLSDTQVSDHMVLDSSLNSLKFSLAKPQIALMFTASLNFPPAIPRILHLRYALGFLFSRSSPCQCIVLFKKLDCHFLFFIFGSLIRKYDFTWHNLHVLGILKNVFAISASWYSFWYTEYPVDDCWINLQKTTLCGSLFTGHSLPC